MASDDEKDINDALSEESSTVTILSTRRIIDVDPEAESPLDENDETDGHNEDMVLKFNLFFDDFLQTKAEVTLDELNRCLVVLGTSPNISQFEPENVDISALFINVHRLISNIESRSSLLWSALSFVEQAAQNSSARVALVQKFKYMEILSKLLDTLNNPDRILRVLNLMECLTYGITITWQEPHLKDLIKTLVNFVAGENENLIAPALSILINLCYKNLPPVYLLLRCIKPDEFLSKIEPYGILACKMSLLLENNLDGVMENDILAFVKFTFSEIHRALRTFNLGLLRHTVEFFADMKANRAVCVHFENYDNYTEDVHCILQYIIAVDKSPDYDVDVVKEAKRSWSLCISLLFEFLINVVDLKADALKTQFPKMASCALRWIVSEKAGTQSLELLTTLVNKDEHLRCLSSVYSELGNNIGNALVIMRTINPSTEQISALLKLLNVLVRERLLDESFSENVKSFLFESILGSLFERYESHVSFEHLNHLKLYCIVKSPSKNKIPIIPQPEVALYIRTLAIISDYASWSTDGSWTTGLDTLMKSPVIQFVIAKAMLSDNAETCSLVFRLAKVNTFPVRETSERIVRQGPLLLARTDCEELLNERSCSVESFPNNIASFNTEQRINDLIDKISTAQKSKQIGNILMSDIMELFEYKITMCTNEERDLLSRLDECNAQVTSLSHKLTLLSAEVSRYQSQNFTLQMNIDRLQETLDTQIEENKRLKRILDNYEMSYNEENSNQMELIKEIEQKDFQICALKNQLICAKDKLKEREDELRRLQDIITSERRQNNDLELCIKNLETLRVELLNKIAQQEQSIQENKEEIALLEKENSSLEDKVKIAERTLQEKTNLLEHYAQDLRDVEEMRSRVVSIMKKQRLSSS